MQPLAVASPSGAGTVAAAASFETSSVVAAKSAAPGKTDQAASGQRQLSFSDVLSGLNPLQHLPVIGTIYRAVTGETIEPVFKIAGAIVGGLLMGGPFGALGAIGSTIAEQVFHLCFNQSPSTTTPSGTPASKPSDASATDAGGGAAVRGTPTAAAAPTAAAPPSAAAVATGLGQAPLISAADADAINGLPAPPSESHVFTMLAALGQTITLAPPNETTPAAAVAAYRNVSAFALG